MKIDNKRIIKLYYTALMTFLVITFANGLLQKVIEYSSNTEYVLYLIFWIALVIQTTYAYRHIMAIKQKRYKALILVSDCLDVLIEVFVCAVICTYTSNGYHGLEDYRLLSIPFMVLAVNQICWYIGVHERNWRAIIRLIILFVGMLTVTISESICPGNWNLAIFVIVHALAMAILRAFDETRRGHKKRHKKRKGNIDDQHESKNNPNPIS